MKILWMKPILPFPPDQGTKRVTLQILKNVAAEHEVVLFTRYLAPAEREQARALEQEAPGLRVHGVIAPNRRSLWHRAGYKAWTWLRAWRGIPPVESYTAPPTLVERFRDLVRREAPDLVVAEYWYAQEYLQGHDVSTVLFAHDMEFQVRARAGSARRDASRGTRWGALEVARERDALVGASRLWTLTEADREAALGLGRAAEDTRIMPFGVDTQRAFPARSEKDPRPKTKSVLLFGSFEADFNRDALEFTLDAVFPELLKLQPEALLRVAGGGLDGALQERCRRRGVAVLGRVTDVRAALLDAEVVLIPLRFGGGLRIRLLEALATECAVVGTPIGVLGMGPQAERDVLVGETPRELAGQIARLLEDPGLRRALGARGRATVRSGHDLETCARRQRELIREAAERRR